MKKLLIFVVSIGALTSCFDDQLTPSNRSDAKTENQIGTSDIVPVLTYKWTKLQVPPMNNYPFNNPTGHNIILPVNGDVYCLIGSLNEFAYKLNLTTNQWEYFSDPTSMFVHFRAGAQYFFSYQSRIYFGLLMASGYETDVRSLDPATGITTQLASFPGTPVQDPITFSIGTKGYIMGGHNPVTNNVVNQFWEYDIVANHWTNKGSMPGGARAAASAFVIGNNVYFGLGYSYFNFNGNKIKIYKNDWYQMDPTSSPGFALIKADFPLTRAYAKGFVINSKIYVGWGTNGTLQNDFWEYNPSNNTWTQRSSCSAINSSIGGTSSNISVFNIGNAGYLVKGDLAEFWRYSLTGLLPI
jgi:hypothetical protein